MTNPLPHLIGPHSLTRDETLDLLALARELKADPIRTDLAGRSIGLLFFSPSLRTRSSMDIAAYQLGGHALTLDVGVGTWKLEHREGVVMEADKAEHIKDAARVLSRYVDALAIRAFPTRKSWGEDRRDPVVTGFSRWAEVPVVNLESALYHPCQGLADALTMQERMGDLQGQPITITWAYHPRAVPMAVPNSILLEACKHGMDVRFAHPKGWELDDDIMTRAHRMASSAGGRLTYYDEMEPALKGSRVIYAKSWGSIRNYRHPEVEDRMKEPLRQRWRVRMRHFDETDDAFFMHCLPVRRGVIVDDEVLDSPRNAAYDEAENRLHVQKALLLKLLAGR